MPSRPRDPQPLPLHAAPASHPPQPPQSVPLPRVAPAVTAAPVTAAPVTAAPEIARRPGRSHPPSLIRLTERLFRDEQLLVRGDTVLCACSGGPDSTALLSVLAHLRARLHFALVAHGVDHGLRPEAPAELAIAGDLARTLRVPFAVTSVHVSPGGNLQARARDARRDALQRAAHLAGARLVATGHTADDRAETFLLRLLRGAGPRGLAVLPPSAPFGPATLIRPLLLARRADVEAHLTRHHIPFARDPSNDDARFLRVRVRHELLPLLESLSPGVADHLCALADMLGALPSPDPDLDALPLGELGRAQRLALARAKKCERPVNLRLPGGREVAVAFSAGKPVLMESSHPIGPHRAGQ